MTAPLTIFILIVTGIATFVAFRRPDLRDRWIFNPYAILRHKEYERMLTSGLIHADWLHFGFNAFSFYSFARNIESIYGWASLLFIYVSAILGGSLLSLIIHRNHDYRALGASGGVCGVIFASIFLLPGSSVMLFLIPIGIPAYIYAPLFLIISFVAHRKQIGNIGHDAHLGGAIVGLLVATAMYPQLMFAEPWLYVLVMGLSIAILVALIFDPLGLWKGRVVETGGQLGGERERRYAENRSRSEKLAEVDRLLDKVAEHGIQSLSDAERKRLEQLSKEVGKSSSKAKTGLGKVFRVIFHLDMDAFYASVEQRDNPSLKGKPVIVGSPPTQRGVVCAASYEARKFGVRSAMPSITAGRLCPKGVFLRPRMEAYRAESHEIMAIVEEFAGDLVQQVSVDEAYVDVSAAHQANTVDASLELALPLARQIKSAIQHRRQITATIGIASNKLLAKLASDFQKPDGLTLIRDSEKVRFLRPLPVRSLHGIGKVTEENLLRAGLRTVGDLQNHPGDLRALVGSWGPELKRFAFGEDDRPLELGDEVKSISCENTFLRDTEDRPTLRACLKEQADDIAKSLAKRRLAARTIQVKVRYGDFTSLTRQISLEEPLTEAKEIYRLGCWLLGREKLVNRPLRLIGLGVSGLVDAQVSQLRLPLES